MDNLLRRPTELGYSTIFFGEPNSFSYTIAPYAIALVSLPTYLLSGGNLILTYNLYWIATFVLTAWTGYLLAQYLLKAPIGIACVVGILISFAQFRFLHSGHVETLSFQFLLLSLYCLHRLIDKPRLGWALALAASFWLTLMASGYLGIYFVLCGVVIISYVLLKLAPRPRRDLFRMLMIAGNIGAVACLPFLLIRTARIGVTYEEFVQFSATPRDWFLGTSQIYTGVLPYRDEVTLFLGFTPILLAFAGWRWRNDLLSVVMNTSRDSTTSEKRTLSPVEVINLYGILVLMGYVMTLGPVLRLGTDPIMPAPFLWLMQIPGVNALRVPARFIVITIIGTSLLCAAALIWLRNRLPPHHYHLVFTGVCALLLIELTPFNGNSTKMLLQRSVPPALGVLETQPYTPPIINEWLKYQPTNTPIFHFPDGPHRNEIFTYLMWQSYHNQPMLNGYGSLAPAWFGTFAWTDFPNASTLTFLIKRNIRYVLIHTNFMTPVERTLFDQRVASAEVASQLKYKEQVGEVLIYEVTANP